MTRQINPMALIRQLLDESGCIPALTMYQPWGSLLACEAKQYETRGWATKYRGWMLIHAGKAQDHWFGDCDKPYLRAVYDALKPVFYPQTMCNQSDLQNAAPYGKIIAIAELVNCWRMVYHPGTDVDEALKIEIGAELDVPKHHPDFHRFIVPTEQELLFGDWTPGRYAWEFANMTMLPEPIPAKGMQRLWRWKGEGAA